MANFLDDLKQTASDMFGSPSASFPKPPASIEDQISALPNSEKLSGTEKWLYKSLPGITESSAGKALMNFLETPFGQSLKYLDVLAEGLERTLGLVAQYKDWTPGDEFKLKEAWKAGSLFYDTVNLPRIQKDENGRITGIRMDTDMPGTYAMTEARKMIQDGKSLEEVRDILYTNLGALSMRAQLNDTLGHVALDPLTWVLGAVKPVERLHALRHLALTSKLDIGYVKGLESAARTAGNLADAEKYAAAIAKAEKSGKAMTSFDKFAVALTGGTPYLADEVSNVTAWTKLKKLNPFALTPQARANELLDIVAANVGEYLIRPNLTKDPEVFMQAVANVAKGGIGDEWGHLAMTVQGRTVQGIMSNADAAVKEVGKEWSVFAGDRRILDLISSSIGKDNREVWQMAQNSDVLFKKILQVSEQPGMEILKAEIQRGSITQEFLQKVSKFDQNIPLTKDEFYVKALVTIQDAAMQQSILQFGIREKGILTKWSDAIKAWETLPFIRANPGNFVRNVINNEVTMIARGVHGVMSDSAIKSFWKGTWMPPQFKRAFGFAGEGEFDASKATERLIRQLEGSTPSLAKKVKAAAGKVELGPLDFSKYSQQLEATHSLRASTNGWLEFHQKYWNPKTGFTSIAKSVDSAVLDELESAVPGISGMLDDVAQAAGADPNKFAELMSKSISVSPTSIFQDASEKLGYKIDDILGTEVTHVVQEGLPKAIEQGNVREFLDGVKLQMEQHVDDLFNKHVENLPGIVAAQVQAGGPMQYHRIFAKAADEFWGGNVEHAIRMSSINELMESASKADDYQKISTLWNKILADSDSHFGRVWKKFDAYQEGLAQGAKNAGLKYPDEVKNAFKDMKTGWNDMFKFRNEEYKKFFDAKLAGKEYKKTLETIRAEISKRYRDMVEKEDELYQRVDDLMAGSLDDFGSNLWKNYRDKAADLRLKDRQMTTDFFEKIQTTSKDEQPALWAKYWQDRMGNLEEIRKLDARGSSAIQGSEQAVAEFAKRAETEPGTIFDLANQYNIPSATKTGARNDRRILSTVNKYLPEGTEKFKSLDEVPLDIARQAFEARNATKTGQAAEVRSFIPDVEMIFKDPMPIETGLSQLNYGRGYAAMDALADSASDLVSKAKPSFFKDLPEHLQKKVMAWSRQVEDEMSAFRTGAVSFAAFRRDSALLNYSRRTNFDNALGHMAPFAFWTTHSIQNWAIHSIDRPAMMTSFLRTRQFFETAGLTDQNVPKRLRGNIRIELPFTPSWMGSQFIDPLRIALPFDTWAQPWEQAQQEKFTAEGRAKETLSQMLDSGVIGRAEYEDAINNKSGDAWDRAMSAAQEGGDNYNAMDFVSMTMTPHAPLMWAYNAAMGKKEDIGPFTPLSRTVKNFATMMGVDDWSNHPYNIEGRIRKSLGLPAFDKWEDYRVGREISNIAADGNHDMNAVNEAMQIAALVESGKMTSKEAVDSNELYALAVKRANQEYAGGWGGAVLGALGINVKSFPTGEQRQRDLADKFSEAYAEYENGNVEALSNFFDEYPEYESRLALFKSPQERLKSFMVDNMWARWNELPKVTQDEMKEQLGSNFENLFINKETRSYDAISEMQLQVWLKLTGGKNVGRLDATTEAMIELNQLKLTDPETAWRVQTFYDSRKGFENWYELQNKYYDLKEKDRPGFIKQNPELKEYWNFRRDWMYKNPDLVRFLTDDEKTLKKYERVKRVAEFAAPTADEIRANMSQPTIELLNEWYAGESLPPSVEKYVEQLAESYGIDARTLLGILTG